MSPEATRLAVEASNLGAVALEAERNARAAEATATTRETTAAQLTAALNAPGRTPPGVSEINEEGRARVEAEGARRYANGLRNDARIAASAAAEARSRAALAQGRPLPVVPGSTGPGGGFISILPSLPIIAPTSEFPVGGAPAASEFPVGGAPAPAVAAPNYFVPAIIVGAALLTSGYLLTRPRVSRSATRTSSRRNRA